MASTDCIFCRIPQDPNADVIYRDDRVYVIRDITPLAPIHLLIIPMQHLGGLAYISAGQIPIMGQLFVVAEEMARREGVTVSGYRVIMNQGPDSGQAVPHLHMHLLAGHKLADLG